MFGPWEIRFLSHVLDVNTPAYGGGIGFRADTGKSMSCGDACNTSHLSLPNHIGTHVDAPLHFIKDGSSLDQYAASEFIFSRVRTLDVSVNQGRLLDAKDLSNEPDDPNAELLLIKTGFQQHRQSSTYIFDGPGLSPSFAKLALQKWPSIRGIGIDFLSVNRHPEKDAGREAHRILLSHRNMLLIEDMDLSSVSNSCSPETVIAVPVRFKDADGAPTTVLGFFKK